MKLKEMVERIKQHHPDMGITEIVRSLNDGMNDMGYRTKIVEAMDQVETVANQRVYPLKKHIIEIKAVDYQGKSIKKLIGRPIERDLT